MSGGVWRFRSWLVAVCLLAAVLVPPPIGAAATWDDAADADCGLASLTADWPERDRLLPTRLPADHWYARPWNDGWGPRAAEYPRVASPPGCDPVAWQRARVVAVARRYLGLPYRHHHVPDWDPPAALVGAVVAGPGLDCSNFTAWVYNYALGIHFTSHIARQAEGPEAPGRILGPDEPLAPGDLLFIWNTERSRVTHVVLYVGDGQVIDSASARGGVTEHALSGWYATHYSHARRVLE
ncbi:MAG: C40 family peptidase [Chloroflexi bacterium]|nr:C40 family peptidase [Chloroflexota bacterium]